MPGVGTRRDAVEAYDYIVVGAGTAGCVLAARLSENPAARVLLLEAGSAGRTRAMTVPNAWPENLGSAADWGYVTTGQAGARPEPDRCRTRGAGPWAGRVPSTPWRTSAATGPSTTAGLRPAPLAGGPMTCCLFSG